MIYRFYKIVFSHQLMSLEKGRQEDKKALLGSLTQSVNPVMRELEEQNTLQMPELALRCAQFFHSISQYCLGYYNNYLKEDELKKAKTKKQDKETGKQPGKRGRKREHKEEKEEDGENRPEPPKKPLTAYIIYFQDKKPNFVERYPTLGLSELTKLIAKEWKELSEQEKQVYLDRASGDRKRYEEQLADFKKMYSKAFGSEIIDLDMQDEEEELAAIINEHEPMNSPDKKSEEEEKEEEEEKDEEEEQEEEDEEEEREDNEEDNDEQNGVSRGSRSGVSGEASEEEQNNKGSGSESEEEEDSVEEVQMQK